MVGARLPAWLCPLCPAVLSSNEVELPHRLASGAIIIIRYRRIILPMPCCSIWAFLVRRPRFAAYHSIVDLFNESRRKNLSRVAPLAVRMRPRTLDEFVGQHHFLGE